MLIEAHTNVRHWFYFHMALVLSCIIPLILNDLSLGDGLPFLGFLGAILEYVFMIGAGGFVISFIFPFFFGVLVAQHPTPYGPAFVVADFFLTLLHFLYLAQLM